MHHKLDYAIETMSWCHKNALTTPIADNTDSTEIQNYLHNNELL